MVDVRTNIVTKLLETHLPVYYEMNVTDVSIPCITYITINDSVQVEGDTLCYSDVIFQIKVWCTEVENLALYCSEIDDSMRGLGLKRTFYNEMTKNELIIGVFQYTGLTKEDLIQEI